MTISIFQGRQARYSELVLEALLKEENLRAWQLASALAVGSEDLRGIKYKTLKIYSVLVRKGGRLDDLLSKGYIRFDDSDKTYRIDFKGFWAILIKRPDLEASINPIQFKNLNMLVLSGKPDVIHSPLGITINRKQMESYIKKMGEILEKDHEIWVPSGIEAMKKLDGSGINFDQIKTDDLLALWIINMKSYYQSEEVICQLNRRTRRGLGTKNKQTNVIEKE